MKNNKEKLFLDGKQAMLLELIHSVAWPSKIDSHFYSQLTDEALRIEAIRQIEGQFLVQYKSAKPEELIHELATLSWGYKFLESITKGMVTKIERDRESNLKLIDTELIYENIKLSNRQAGASKANRRREIDLKKIAKEKWQGYRKSTGKPCGATTLIKLLAGAPGIDDLSVDTAKGWTQQWNKELKKG